VPYLEEWLIKAVADRPNTRWIMMDCRGVNSIDATAVEGLEEIVSGYRSQSIRILLSHVKLEVRERLKNAGWEETFGDLILHPTTRDALHAIGLVGETEANVEHSSED
jgi:SulP family sulfate permease